MRMCYRMQSVRDVIFLVRRPVNVGRWELPCVVLNVCFVVFLVELFISIVCVLACIFPSFSYLIKETYRPIVHIS